jgi:hypothetical protein
VISPPAAGTDVIARAYGLGVVRSLRYLQNGILHRNWRLETVRGVFALASLSGVVVETGGGACGGMGKTREERA